MASLFGDNKGRILAIGIDYLLKAAFDRRLCL